MKSSEPIRVLYVDDNCDSLEMLRVMLGLSEIEVVCVTSVHEALALAGSERFDLYLLDSGLPDGSGVGLCRTLRSTDPEIPVLFYSGKANVNEIERGISAGAAGYITKPNSEELATTIIKLVTKRRESQHAFGVTPFLAAA